MKQLKKYFAPAFKGEGLSKIWYAMPLVIWGIGLAVYAVKTTKVVSVAQQHLQKSAIATALQNDINYISTQTKKNNLFKLSKTEIMKDDKQQNFLMKRAKRQLEKSEFYKSQGAIDGQKMLLDSSLNLSIAPSIDTSIDSTEAQKELDYVMDQYKHTEQERQAALAQAKKEQQQKIAAVEQSHLAEEAQAYQQGIQDHHRLYNEFHGIPNTNITPQNAQTKTTKKQKLAFATSMGIKDDLKMNNFKQQNTQKQSLNNTPFKQAFVPNSNPIKQDFRYPPLKAVIDQGQKRKSGDKIQLRVLEDGFYKNQPIKANSILYGICAINERRMYISIASLTIEQQLIKAALEVYDLDGMRGIYIDGAYDDISKQVIDQGLNAANSFGLSVPVLGDFSLNLGRKLNRASAAHIPSGYQVLLYDKSIQ